MKILSTTEAAQRLSISQRRVVALIQSGRLPAKKIGSVWVIKEKDLHLVSKRETGRPKKGEDHEHHCDQLD